MIEPSSWMRQAVSLLRTQFGSRLLFVGLQGSYRRGEAHEDSDIDIVSILDTLDVHDLEVYRSVLRTLPEGEKACGFTCGREELLAWPAFELFQFAQDTEAWYGELTLLLPPVTHRDIVTGARAGVSGLYHAVAHLYVSGEAARRAEDLRPLYKGCFFALQAVQYLRHGSYAQSKKELLESLSGDEAELLRLGLDSSLFDARRRSDPDALFQLLLGWSGKALRELARDNAADPA